MSASEDRRVRKTREALQASFAALVVSKGYDALTIQEVLDDADVGRTTFYSHFRSKEDLLRSSFDRLRAEVAEAPDADGEPFAFVVALFAHARRHAGLYRALLTGSGGRIAQEEVAAVVRRLVAGETDRLGLSVNADREAVITFASGGLVQALEDWVRPGQPNGADDYVGAIRRIAARTMAGGAGGTEVG